MRLMFRGLILCLFLLLFSTSPVHAFKDSLIKEVSYSYADNFKGWVSVPSYNARKAPIIIYNYHEDYEKSLIYKTPSYTRDIRKFVEEFNNWGVITFVPKRGGRNVNAIRGAIQYVKSMKDGDKERIYLMGVSEGVLLSFLALEPASSIRGVIAVNPRLIDDTGFLSYPELLRRLPQLDLSVLHIMGTALDGRDVNASLTFNRIINERGLPIDFRKYPETEKWFWDPNSLYMDDVREFIIETVPFQDPLFGPQIDFMPVEDVPPAPNPNPDRGPARRLLYEAG